MAASLAVHAAGGLVVQSVVTPPAPPPVDEPMILVDLDVVREAPAPEDLDAEEPAAPPEVDPEIEPAGPEPATASIEPAPPDEPGEPIAEVPIDAGVPDAMAVADDSLDVDAGTVAMTADAGADAASAVATAAMDAAATTAGEAIDAGVAVAAATTAPAMAGDPGAQPTDGDAAPGATAGAGAGDAFPGTGANLLAYMPTGDLITVMIRFDRLRGTKWSRPTEQLLAPMPDYRSLIAGRAVELASLFDTLVISTPSPADVAETTLVAHTPRTGSAMRDFLDTTDTPVSWSVAAGGPLGRRGRSALVFPGDPRVFLMPYRNWVVLAHPRHLGALTAPAAGDLDQVIADPAALPGWLRDVRAIERESGTTDGPAVMLTLRKLADAYETPLGTIPGPERLTATVEVTDEGFVVRGNLAFASAAAAGTFVTTVEDIRTRLADSRIIRVLLAQAHALRPIESFKLGQSGERVAFSTWVTESDGRALLALAAARSRAYFTGQRAAPQAVEP